MFTYVTLGVNDFEAALLFYDQVLAALGWSRCDPDAPPGWAGWGVYEDDGRRETALWICRPFDGRPATAGNGTMVALAAATREQVEVFHRRALAAGGRSEGAPALRPHYGADFFAAYVRDPDGNKLAAVCRAPALQVP
jgi:catechol 2,3-dioxygenase-like lactoylglutathione lyase family enzyme